MAGSNFVDYVKIYCRSGKGGAGSLHFRREKYIPKGGPDGGDGGRGGNIILRGNAQMWTLLHLRYTKHLMAEDGVPGGSNQLTGAAGKDVYIDINNSIDTFSVKSSATYNAGFALNGKIYQQTVTFWIFFIL